MRLGQTSRLRSHYWSLLQACIEPLTSCLQQSDCSKLGLHTINMDTVRWEMHGEHARQIQHSAPSLARTLGKTRAQSRRLAMHGQVNPFLRGCNEPTAGLPLYKEEARQWAGGMTPYSPGWEIRQLMTGMQQSLTARHPACLELFLSYFEHTCCQNKPRRRAPRATC